MKLERIILNVIVVSLALMLPTEATTIAYDGKTMASDSQVTVGCCHKEFKSDKIKFVAGCVIGGAGLVDDIDVFVAWFEAVSKGKKVDKPTLRRFSAIVVRPDGKAYLYVEDCVPIRIGHPFAIGSGSRAAVSAMRCGVTARKAVEVACETDLYSSGPIIEVPCPQVPDAHLRK
jgi:ATP-dependent protease HslVU (ClpYQ) peptidase subunit